MNGYKKIILYTFLTYIVCWCGILLLSPAFIELFPISAILFLITFLIILALTFIMTKADKGITVCKAYTLSVISYIFILTIICCYISYIVIAEDGNALGAIMIALITMPTAFIFVISTIVIWLNNKKKDKNK